MYLQIILQGILIGVTIAAPVGPIGILCIRRTLAEGRLAGFISGLGAATADAMYGAIAAFGLTFISIFLINQSFWLRLFGGSFLIYLGIKTFLTVPSKETGLDPQSSKDANLISYYVSTLFLTLTNPLTIISFAAIFAGFGIVTNQSHDNLTASSMVLGIFLGSSIWWLSLSFLTGLFRKTVNHKTMIWINRISGTIIVSFGLLALISILLINPL
ncbi:MAG: LysE family translocator [Anaerolineales bacterium]